MRRKAHHLGQRLFHIASTMPPERLKFGTFKSKDVPLDALREASQAIMRAARATLKAVDAAHYALRCEFALAPATIGYRPHVHVILNTAPTGRRYVSASHWTDAWLSELPVWLHPANDPVYMNPVRDLPASCAYLVKSAFARAVPGSIRRIPRQASEALKWVPSSLDFSFSATLRKY